MRRIGMEKTDIGMGEYPQQNLFASKKVSKKEVKEKMGKEKRKEGFGSLVKLSFLKKCFRR